MRYRPAVGPKCETGGCSCSPMCEPQAARVEAFIASQRKPAPAPRVFSSPPAGHAWLCVACAQIQQTPEPHCGYPVKLVETRGLKRDPVTGRVTEATSADNEALYRRAPSGSLKAWKAHGT